MCVCFRHVMHDFSALLISLLFEAKRAAAGVVPSTWISLFAHSNALDVWASWLRMWLSSDPVCRGTVGQFDGRCSQDVECRIFACDGC